MVSLRGAQVYLGAFPLRKNRARCSSSNAPFQKAYANVMLPKQLLWWKVKGSSVIGFQER
jgi:hypothetical protein